MMRGKAIRHFLIEGQADGRWVSELSNWTGKSYKIPRTYVNSCGDRSDLNNTGVYFLFGRNDDTDMDQVYIGEAENILTRIKAHLTEKDFWTECVVFISKDNNLNKAHVKYLEYHLYLLAKEANKYEILNTNTPTESSISEMDRAEMDEFIDNMRLILSVLGHKVLEPSRGTSHGKGTAVFYLHERTGANASGKMSSDGFVVLKGSKIAEAVQPSLSPSTVNRRSMLVEKGIIDEQNVCTQDWAFSSPTLAATVVVGYNINGRVAWKTKKGIPLKEMEAEL